MDVFIFGKVCDSATIFVSRLVVSVFTYVALWTPVKPLIESCLCVTPAGKQQLSIVFTCRDNRTRLITPQLNVLFPPSRGALDIFAGSFTVTSDTQLDGFVLKWRVCWCFTFPPQFNHLKTSNFERVSLITGVAIKYWSDQLPKWVLPLRNSVEEDGRETTLLSAIRKS